MYNHNAPHASKHAIRQRIIQNLKRLNRPLRKVALLPGSKCIDLLELANAGLITKDTEVLLFETDGKTIERIFATLREKYPYGFKKIRIFQSDFRDFDLVKSHQSKPFDFIFADFCGEFDGKDLEWSLKNGRVLRSVYCAITYSIIARKSKILKSKEFLETYALPFRILDQFNSCSIGFFSESEMKANQNAGNTVSIFLTAINGTDSKPGRWVDVVRVYTEPGSPVAMVYADRGKDYLRKEKEEKVVEEKQIATPLKNDCLRFAERVNLLNLAELKKLRDSEYSYCETYQQRGERALLTRKINQLKQERK